jgi:hypothetical protein
MPAPWQPPDLDEIRPDRFVINNEKVRPFLRGEGEREGVFFQLQTTRRAGWIARLRMAGFNVRTLIDRINALPSIGSGIELGPEAIRPLATARERFATWDSHRLRWRDAPIEPIDNVPAVRLHVNEPLRRRKGRGGGDYFIAVPERPGRIGLKPVKEVDAIVHAYGLLASRGRPAILHYVETTDGYLVPANQSLLPEPHREALARLALDHAERWVFAPDQFTLAEEIFEKLGIRLEQTSKVAS